LASALARRGHDVRLVVPPWDNPAFSGKQSSLQGVGVHHVRLPPRFPPFWYPMITWRTLELALKHRPQVIHAFKPKAFSGLAAMASWLLKKAHLLSARLVIDTDDWEGDGGWNQLGPYGPIQRRFFAFQEGWGLHHADAVTVASRALESLAIQAGVPEERVFYVPNGTAGDGGRGEANYVDGPDQSPTLLLYTRFFEFQPQRLVSIFRQVLERAPQARLLIVGRGTGREEDEVVRLARMAGILDRIQMVGWARQDELPGYFRQAQVALYPLDDTLLNRAKCPLKLVELMEAGFPVVADNVGQASEYIVDEESGLLAPPGDVSAFSSRVMRLVLDAGLRRRLGEEARNRVVTEFHWDRLAERLEKAYGI
ncbi:MAG: glycosyltransferase family 4 protein, partial [Dehalococcoidia bacterium]|nr:glycosyltransferase family 4 protein [Dehalococcoidia bacterium]